MFDRAPIDLESYHREAQAGPCFICRIVARDPGYPAEIIYEDEIAIAFLDRYPTFYGYSLLAPKEHRTQVTGDFSIEEYTDLQRALYRVAEAVRLEVGAERLYLLSLGSSQGHAHVHWHIVPCRLECPTASSSWPPCARTRSWCRTRSGRSSRLGCGLSWGQRRV